MAREGGSPKVGKKEKKAAGNISKGHGYGIKEF